MWVCYGKQERICGKQPEWIAPAHLMNAKLPVTIQNGCDQNESRRET